MDPPGSSPKGSTPRPGTKSITPPTAKSYHAERIRQAGTGLNQAGQRGKVRTLRGGLVTGQVRRSSPGKPALGSQDMVRLRRGAGHRAVQENSQLRRTQVHPAEDRDGLRGAGDDPPLALKLLPREGQGIRGYRRLLRRHESGNDPENGECAGQLPRAVTGS